MHRENAEGAGGPERAAHGVREIDAQHGELGIHELVFPRHPGGGVRSGGQGNVAQDRGKTANARLTPDGATSPRHAGRPEVADRDVHGTRNPRRQRVHHLGIEAGDRASLVIVSGGFEEMTGTGVRVGRCNDKAIHADAVGARGHRPPPFRVSPPSTMVKLDHSHTTKSRRRPGPSNFAASSTLSCDRAPKARVAVPMPDRRLTCTSVPRPRPTCVMPRAAKLASSPGRNGLGPCPMFSPISPWMNTKAYGGNGHPSAGGSDHPRGNAPRTP